MIAGNRTPVLLGLGVASWPARILAKRFQEISGKSNRTCQLPRGRASEVLDQLATAAVRLGKNGGFVALEAPQLRILFAQSDTEGCRLRARLFKLPVQFRSLTIALGQIRGKPI